MSEKKESNYQDKLKSNDNPLTKWRNSLTQEEKEAIKVRASEGRKKTWARKRALKEEMAKSAPEMLVRLFAEELKSEIEGKNFTPSHATTEKLRALVDKGMTIKEIRTKYFSGVDQVVWDKVIRHMLKDQVANEEDLGIQLLQSQQSHKKTLQKQLSSLRRDLRRFKRDKQPAPIQLRKLELDLTEKIFNLDVNVAEAMLKLGVVGEKQKSANINLHFSVPRPKKEKEVVAIEV